jgi:hypothetical protein
MYVEEAYLGRWERGETYISVGGGVTRDLGERVRDENLLNGPRALFG